MLGRRLLLATCALAPLGGCARGHGGRAIRVGVARLRISLPVFVAVERGLFSRRGLDVALLPFDTAQPLVDELATGRLDAGGYAALPILLAASPPRGLRFVTALVEDSQHPLSFLLVKKGSGLRGVGALRGKRVGVLPTIAYQRWLRALLEHEGLAPNAVSAVPTAPHLQVQALAGGGVDALFTGDPMATAALALGVAEPLTATPDVPRVLGEPFLFGTFAIGGAFAQSDPSSAQLLRDALDEAIGLLEEDPALGRRCMLGYLREPERPFVDQYPVARYLRSGDVPPELLERTLRLDRPELTADDVSLR